MAAVRPREQGDASRGKQAQTRGCRQRAFPQDMHLKKINRYKIGHEGAPIAHPLQLFPAKN
ncbi:hypothetical protein KIN20_011831 [Parelaphostrongylus tenuis]|uniref:Uncharacterized protein n=1 Tax=Parelaphostrongylus tenuis TaxID=148309 RepID=A0AAD5N0L4_PARTN|nr:hypothetical protein KIN20_011831 [Parelaphostrongylus tenuis]